jgi:ParB-like chromosome segregation protein Spo0J
VENMTANKEFPNYKTASVADLIPYARNSRTHSPQQVDKIAASIREFGFLNPIIVDGQNGIVAEQTGRCCYAIELNPAYVDVAVKRWQDFTGQEATLEGSGETFNAMASRRIAA